MLNITPAPRRINIHNRLVYQILRRERIVKVLRMWTHYEERPARIAARSTRYSTIFGRMRVMFPFHTSAVIFDFDETIIDLEAQHEAADAALCARFGDDYYRLPASFRESSGRRILDVVREMRRLFGWTEPVDRLMEIRQRLFDDICRDADLTLLPGVSETLDAIHSAGIPMAITTSAVRSSIEIILERFGLRDAFAVIVDGSAVAAPKPHPEAYLLTAKQLRVDPRRCVVFEDSNVGVLAAKAAGMFCIGVRNPSARMAQDLSAADVVVDSMRDAPGMA